MNFTCPVCHESMEFDAMDPVGLREALAAHLSILFDESDPGALERAMAAHVAEAKDRGFLDVSELTDETIRKAPDEELPMLAWSSVLSREPLTSRERVFFHVEHLNMEVLNGGLVQYFLNTGGNDVAEARDALRAMGATHHAAVFDEAITVWEAERTVPGSWWDDERGERAFEESDVRTLDDRFCSVPLEPIEAAYIREDPSAFVHKE